MKAPIVVIQAFTLRAFTLHANKRKYISESGA